MATEIVTMQGGRNVGWKSEAGQYSETIFCPTQQWNQMRGFGSCAISL